MEDKGPIDLVRYGVLWNKIENYENKFASMEKKIDDMESDLKKLVLMAERSKGSLWALMGVALQKNLKSTDYYSKALKLLFRL